MLSLHVNSVERACYFTVAVTNAAEIALVRAAKRYRGRLTSVKPDVRMLFLDFAVVSGASEVRDHATSSARGFAGDLRYFFCHLLLPWIYPAAGCALIFRASGAL